MDSSICSMGYVVCFTSDLVEIIGFYTLHQCIVYSTGGGSFLKIIYSINTLQTKEGKTLTFSGIYF